MAIATLFTELDLDLTKFQAKQKKLLEDIKKVGKDSEFALQQSFQNLGVTSDAVYQLMANKAIASYDRIAKSGKASADEQFRAQSAMVAKINALNQEMTKNPLYETLGIRSAAAINAQKTAVLQSYETLKTAAAGNSAEIVRIETAKNAKLATLNKEMAGGHTTTLASMTRDVLRLYATYYVLQSVAAQAFAFMEKGAKALQIESSFKIMAEESGVDAGKWISNMKAATKETIDDSDLMQKATKLMLAGYNPDQIERFSKVAITASQYMGVTVAESYERISDALASRMPRAMIQAGAVTREQMKVVTAAIAAGATQAQLMELAIANLSVKQLQLQGTTDSATLSMQRFHAQVQETGETLGKILIIGMREAYAVFQAFGVISLETSSAIYKVLAARNAFAAAVHFGDAAKQYKADADAYKAMADSDKAAAESLRKQMIDNFTGNAEDSKKATKQAIDDEKAKRDAIYAGIKAIADKKEAAKQAEKDAKNNLDAETALNKEYYDDAIDKSNHWLKMQQISGAGDLEATKQVIEDKKVALNIWYDAQAASINKYTKEATKKYAELSKLDTEYSKSWNQLANEDEETAAKIKKQATDDRKKIYDEQVKASEEYRKMVAEEQSFSVDKHTAAMLKITANEETKLLAAEKLMDMGKISWDKYQAYLVLVTQNTAIAIADLLQQELADKADFYSKITGYEDEYRKNKFKWIDEEGKRLGILYKDEVAAAKWAAQEKMKFDEKVRQDNLSNIAAGMGASAQAFETLAGLYAEDSKERKIFHDISMAFAIAEKAALMAKAISAAVVAVAEQAGTGPVVGFVAMAAMAAAMAALLAQIGVAFSGGGSSSSAPSLPKSTVLGAADGTASASIANSYKLMEDTYEMTDTKLTNIYNALRDLNSSIIGLVTSIFRMGGISTEGYESSWMPGSELQQTAMKNTLTTAFDALFISMGDWISLIFGSNTLVENFMNAIFGSVDTEFQAGGIEIGATIVKSIMDGASISAQWYAKTKTTTTGPLWGLFGGNSESTGIQYNPLDQKVTHMLTLVFSNLGSTLVELAKGLGTDVQKVYDYVFQTTQIDLNGMDAEKMSKALNDYFSSIADKAAETLFGSIILQYQKLNEALLETAVRLVNDKAIVETVLKMTGQAFVAFSDTLYGQYVLTEKWKNWAATGAFGIEPLKWEVFETATQKTIAFSEALVEMAGGLDKLTEAASTYFDKFFSDVEKQASLQSNLTDVLALQNETLPTTRDGYRALVEGLDLTTTSGQEAYITLLKLSESADAYYSYLEEIAKKKQDMEIQIMELTGDAAGALAAQRAIELAALDESLRPLQQRIWALQDEAQAITDVTASIDTLKNRAQQIAQFIIDMGMSAQAPVQSAAAWDTEYARQKTLAMASGATDQQISDYLAFAKQYLSFEQSYGTTGSYQEIYDAIMKDVTGLGTATNTALDIAQKQLDVLIQIRDGVGSGNGDSMPNPNINRWPVFDSGISGPASSKTYTKSDQQSLGNIIAQAIQSSNGGSNGGDIHVSVQIDGREIGNVVAKQTKTNPDLQTSIRSLN